MHEASIMQSTLQLAEEHLRKAGATRIHRISIRVGLLSGVVPEALEFAFDVMKAGTPACEAVLEIIKAPGRFFCAVCDLEQELDVLEFRCPKCGGFLNLLGGGTELELMQLQVS